MSTGNLILVVVACMMPFMFAAASARYMLKTYRVGETLPVAEIATKAPKYAWVMADPKDYDDTLCSADDVDVETFVSLVKVTRFQSSRVIECD